MVTLYDKSNEHDACGIGLLADLKRNKTHQLVDNALTVLENMQHRGAESERRCGHLVADSS